MDHTAQIDTQSCNLKYCEIISVIVIFDKNFHVNRAKPFYLRIINIIN